MIRSQFIKDLSIKNKIIVIVLFVVFTALSAGFISIASWDIKRLSADTKSNLVLNAKLIGDYCVVPLFFGDKTQAADALLRLKFLESVEEGYLFDENGDVFAKYPESASNPQSVSNTKSAPDTLAPVFDKGSEIVVKDGFYYITEPVFFQEKQIGLILIKANTNAIVHQKYKLILTLSLLVLFLLFVSYLLVSAMQKLVSEPILNLTRLTTAISKNQNFTVQLEQKGKDEVGFLYEQFNNMLSQLLKRQNERDIAEDEIRSLNASLEKKVADRTVLLEEAYKELEAFSYSVSHDLRAPLRHINGYLDLLIKRNSDQLDEKGKHYSQSILEASNHMGHLIDDLLNFSRTGRMDMNVGNVNMNKALRDSIAILASETQGRNIEWKIDELPNVYADFSMMRQVWTNLISNAIKYSKKRDVAIIEVGSNIEEHETVFFVKDNGAGFDMKYAQKLFGVFQRMHSTEEFEGTGIGLANVRQIIKRHNGRTWAEGEIDKGATFYFSIPTLKEKSI
ncbi:MAG: hypothetical protein ACD_77C00018G0003 [uncultured bacterium]|nr:MAG: hypothetical protein ACD_77C00018G0003 [uncultured bacterium]HBY01761.1 hypothetical protein [Rikenellaceae bacterium]